LRHLDLKRWRIARGKLFPNRFYLGVNYSYDFPTGKFLIEYKGEFFRTSDSIEKTLLFPYYSGRMPIICPGSREPGY